MTDQNLDESLSGDVQPDEFEDQELTLPEKPKHRNRALLPLIGLLFIALVGVLSAGAGYYSGINLRTQAEDTQVALTVQEQFNLALQDLQQGLTNRAQQRLDYAINLNPSLEQAAAMSDTLFQQGLQATGSGNFQLARMLFEAVIRLDPNYPGATDQLTQALLALNATQTPTPEPTPSAEGTPAPNANPSGDATGLFSQGQQASLDKDWNAVIDTLLRLRKDDPTFQAVAVDGMLFIALRNRGIDKIIKEADLEGGLYDLSLASKFGPLDSEAQGYLNWTSLYITGASFWELDWRQAVFYLEQVAPQFPGLRDGSGLTAKERYRLALIGLGDTLMREGTPCQAVDQYQLSLSIGPDPLAEEGLVEAVQGCEGKGQKESEPPPEEQPTEAPAPTAYPPPAPAP